MCFDVERDHEREPSDNDSEPFVGENTRALGEGNKRKVRLNCLVLKG